MFALERNLDINYKKLKLDFKLLFDLINKMHIFC